MFLMLLLDLASTTYHIPSFGLKLSTLPRLSFASTGRMRRLLQVTTDSIDFSVLVPTNETNTTQAAILGANLTFEGYTSSTAPALVLATCPANSISPEGSTTVSQCTCLAGYQGNASNGTDCSPCPQNTYCASGRLGLCPAHANAPALSDSNADCSCDPGFTGDGSCSQCPANSFCTGGSALTACTPNAVSPVQSTVNSSCYCDRGYYGVDNNPCVQCEPGSWCWTGIKNQCSANRMSAAGSSRATDCICLDGFQDLVVVDNANQSTSVCTACPANSFCKVFNSRNPIYNTHPPPLPNAHQHADSFCIAIPLTGTDHLPRRRNLTRRHHLCRMPH